MDLEERAYFEGLMSQILKRLLLIPISSKWEVAPGRIWDHFYDVSFRPPSELLGLTILPSEGFILVRHMIGMIRISLARPTLVDDVVKVVGAMKMRWDKRDRP